MRALVLALVLLAGTVGAVAPILQDDAGSGADASQISALAPTVGPGVHSGRLSAGIDTEDRFRVPVAAGDVLAVTLVSSFEPTFGALVQPDGETWNGIVAPQREVMVATSAGLAEVRVSINPDGPVDVAYSFVIERKESAWHAAESTNATMLVAEFAWDEPTDIAVGFRLSRGVDLTHAGIMHEFTEYDVWSDGQRYQGAFGGGFGAGGLGGDVVILGNGVLRTPTLALPFEGTSMFETVELAGFEAGWIRLLLYHEGDSEDIRTQLSTAASRQVDHAATSVPRAVSWTRSGSDATLAAPGLAIDPASARDLLVSNATFGDLRGGSTGGRLIAPDGSIHDLGPNEGIFARGLTPGTWRLEVEPRTATRAPQEILASLWELPARSL